jgi:hypothetical protein
MFPPSVAMFLIALKRLRSGPGQAMDISFLQLRFRSPRYSKPMRRYAIQLAFLQFVLMGGC